MGTRGAVGFRLDGDEHIAYNHFDSYPEALGAGVIDFIGHVNADAGWDKLKGLVRELSPIDMDEAPDPEAIARYRTFADTNVGNQRLDDWYCLLRELQGAPMLEAVYQGVMVDYPDEASFLDDTLFCEFAYIIDLDTMELEFRSSRRKGERSTFKLGDPITVKDLLRVSR